MAVSALLSPQLVVSGFDHTAWWDQAEVGIDIAMNEVTTFGGGGFKAYTVGLRSAIYVAAGFADFAAGSESEWLRTNALSSALVVATAAPAGGATGSLANISRGTLQGYRQIDAAVGAVPRVALNLAGFGLAAEGQVTQASTSTITASGNSTPVQIGALSSTQNVYAAVHVLTAAGTSPTIVAQVQSAATSGGAYTNRGSAGAVLSAAGGQWLVTSLGAAVTDTFWRIAWTVTGTTPSFTVLASLAVA